jgi:hypothetical protein
MVIEMFEEKLAPTNFPKTHATILKYYIQHTVLLTFDKNSFELLQDPFDKMDFLQT